MASLSLAERSARKKERARQYYLANRERILAQHKARRGTPDGRAKMAEMGRRYYQEHREATLARQKAYHARPEVKAHRAAYAKARAGLPEVSARANAAARCYRMRHPERASAATMRWALAHPENRAETGRSGSAMFRVRLYRAKCERVSFAAIVERDKGICQICGQPVDFAAPPRSPLSPSWDHVIPFSRGGSHTYDNVQLVHLVCNQRKGERTPAEAAGDQS